MKYLSSDSPVFCLALEERKVYNNNNDNNNNDDNNNNNNNETYIAQISIQIFRCALQMHRNKCNEMYLYLQDQ